MTLPVPRMSAVIGSHAEKVPGRSEKPRPASRSDKVRPRSRFDQRVIVKPKRKRSSPIPGKPVRDRTKPKRYKADLASRGAGTVIVCVSLPPAELAKLDRWAERTQASRSHFIRQAVKHFAGKIWPDEDPHDP